MSKIMMELVRMVAFMSSSRKALCWKQVSQFMLDKQMVDRVRATKTLRTAERRAAAVVKALQAQIDAVKDWGALSPDEYEWLTSVNRVLHPPVPKAEKPTYQERMAKRERELLGR